MASYRNQLLNLYGSIQLRTLDPSIKKYEDIYDFFWKYFHIDGDPSRQATNLKYFRESEGYNILMSFVNELIVFSILDYALQENVYIKDDGYQKIVDLAIISEEEKEELRYFANNDASSLLSELIEIYASEPNILKKEETITKENLLNSHAVEDGAHCRRGLNEQLAYLVAHTIDKALPIQFVTEKEISNLIHTIKYTFIHLFIAAQRYGSKIFLVSINKRNTGDNEQEYIVDSRSRDELQKEFDISTEENIGAIIISEHFINNSKNVFDILAALNAFDKLNKKYEHYIIAKVSRGVTGLQSALNIIHDLDAELLYTINIGACLRRSRDCFFDINNNNKKKSHTSKDNQYIVPQKIEEILSRTPNIFEEKWLTRDNVLLDKEKILVPTFEPTADDLYRIEHSYIFKNSFYLINEIYKDIHITNNLLSAEDTIKTADYIVKELSFNEYSNNNNNEVLASNKYSSYRFREIEYCYWLREYLIRNGYLNDTIGNQELSNYKLIDRVYEQEQLFEQLKYQFLNDKEKEEYQKDFLTNLYKEIDILKQKAEELGLQFIFKAIKSGVPINDLYPDTSA